jgi:predicted site-specific integrase-resolvase
LGGHTIQSQERRMTYSIRQAAKIIGINRFTLRRWLETDLGYRVPKVARGSKVILSHFDVQRILAKHSLRMERQAQP